MRHAITAALLLAALAPAPTAASPFGALLHMQNLSAAGWQAGSALQKSAPLALRSNCGFLSHFVAATCTTMRAGMQRACCEALCAWNAVGCACAPDASALVRSVSVTNGPLPGDLQPSNLATSICNFHAAELYAPGRAGSCANVPAGGSARCPAAKPARESGCANPSTLGSKRKANVATLIAAAYLPVNTSPAAVRTTLKGLLTSKGEALANEGIPGGHGARGTSTPTPTPHTPPQPSLQPIHNNVHL